MKTNQRTAGRAAGFKLRRLHRHVAGPGGGYYPLDVAAARAEALVSLGDLRAALAAYQRNADWADRCGRDDAAAAHLALGIHLTQTGRHDDAEPHVARAGELYRVLDDRAQQRTVALWQSKLSCSRGQFDRALATLAVLEGEIPADDAAMWSSVAAFRGNVHFWKGEFDLALAGFGKYLDYTRAYGRKDLELIGLLNVGLALRECGRLDEAAAHFERVMAQARPFGFLAYYAHALGSLGGVHCYRGKLRLAQTCFEEQLRLTERMGDAYSTNCAVADLASIAIELGELGQARRLAERELKGCRRMKDELGISFASYKLAQIATDEGRLDLALPQLQWCVTEAQRLDSDRFLDIYLVQLAEVCYRRGALAAAAQANEQGLPLQPGNHQTAVPKAVMRARLLAARDPAAAADGLSALLATAGDQQAAVCRALYDVTGQPDYRERALALLADRNRQEPSPRLEREIAALRQRGME